MKIKEIWNKIKPALIGLGLALLGLFGSSYRKTKEENKDLKEDLSDAKLKISNINEITRDFKDKENEKKVDPFVAPNDSDSLVDRLNGVFHS